ncbi:hypothetical protein ACFVT5_08645 [Streptomyces sp. NPDC058001]|uniref:hypothetical protein n=1 Tax=Streptomyces sp. NPDC058001 TaxID=3346300 RepID=UPI0036F0355D
MLNTLRVGDPRKSAGIIVRLATDPALAHTTGGDFSVPDAKALECPEPGGSEHLQRELRAETAALLAGIDAP